MLSLEGVVSGYGPVRVLRGLTLHVSRGTVAALIGPNGAGKTTTLRTVSGLIRPSAGTVTFEGQRIDGAPADRIVAMGLAHVAEGRGVLPELTVLENLRLGGYPLRRSRALVEEGVERAFELFPVLRERTGQLAGSLSGGEQQMLVIGRALVARPRLLMVDEMSLGLAPRVVRTLLATVQRLREEGMTILLVEQYVHLALTVADHVWVLEKGTIAASGTPEEIQRSRAVLTSAYLGPGGQQGEDRHG